MCLKLVLIWLGCMSLLHIVQQWKSINMQRWDVLKYIVEVPDDHCRLVAWLVLSFAEFEHCSRCPCNVEGWIQSRQACKPASLHSSDGEREKGSLSTGFMLLRLELPGIPFHSAEKQTYSYSRSPCRLQDQ